MGNPGPDTGYALTLVGRCVDNLTLGAGEHREDVVSGLAALAAKRAASYGRAPVRHDLDVAVTIWGFASTAIDPELAELRRTTFEGVGDPHHYEARRALVDMVPESALRQTPDAVVDAIRRFESTTLWSPQEIRAHARQFSVDAFRRKFTAFYEACVGRHAVAAK